jgi:hypothetical protein
MNNFEAQIRIAYDMSEGNKKLASDIKELQNKYKVEFGVDLDTKTAKKSLNQFSDEYKKALSQNKIVLDNKLSAYLRENTKLGSGLKEEFNKIRNSLGKIDNASDLKNLQKEFSVLKTEANALGVSGKSAFDNLKGNMKSFATFVFGGGILMSGINSIKEMVTNVIELDNQLLELSKVSDLSANGLKKVTNEAYALGEQVGKTGTTTLSAITDFVRAGYTLQESMGLAKEALKMTNVSENIKDAGVAANDLVHILNGLGKGADYAKTINDAINEVDVLAS